MLSGKPAEFRQGKVGWEQVWAVPLRLPSCSRGAPIKYSQQRITLTLLRAPPDRQVLGSSDFEARRAAAAKWNTGNRWRKRGLAAIPTKFGISFTTKFLNQAGALVHSASFVRNRRVGPRG